MVFMNSFNVLFQVTLQEESKAALFTDMVLDFIMLLFNMPL